LTAAKTGPLADFQRARAELLRGQIAFASTHSAETPQLLVKAAQQFEPLDPGVTQKIHLETLHTTLFADRLAFGGSVIELTAATRATPPAPKPRRALDLLLNGLALTIIEDYSAGAPILTQAMRAFCATTMSAEDVLRWGWHSCYGAALLWDYASWDFLSARWVEVAREAGALP